MRLDWQKISVFISFVSLIVAGSTTGYTFLVIEPARHQQEQQILELQALQLNYTTKVIPFVAEQPEFTVRAFKDPTPMFHVTFNVIIETPHSGDLRVTQIGFRFGDGMLLPAFNNQSNVKLVGNNYVATVGPGSSEKTFDLTFESNVYANMEWFDSQKINGTVVDLGSVVLQITFHDAQLDSTTTIPFEFPLQINYNLQ